MDYRDVLFGLGLLLIVLGIALWSKPAALIAAGLALAAIALYSPQARRRQGGK